MNQTKPFRILGISLSSRGFGYAVMDRNSTLIDYGKKRIDENKNARVPGHIEKVIARNLPDILVLSDVNAEGAYRCRRIKKLDQAVIALAKSHKLKVVKISGTELREALLGNEAGTKHEMAELLAKRYPDQLASRLPPMRRAWDSENARMDIFDAVAITFVNQALNVKGL